jgi:LysM domain
VSSVPRKRWSRKIRRAEPHQAEEAAQQAGTAEPALALAGALTAAPQGHEPAPHRLAVAKQAIRLGAHRAARTYTVQPGDTLAGIAQRFYGQAIAWPWLYEVNRAVITDPGLISPGLVLDVPPNPPASSTASGGPEGAHTYRPRHAAAPSAVPSAAPPPPVPPAQGAIFGDPDLPQLWVAGGGNPADEAVAARIAEHEPAGDRGAKTPTSEDGSWREHDDPAALDPAVSEQTAFEMSSDETAWWPWATEPDC